MRMPPDDMTEHCVPARMNSTRSCDYPSSSIPNRAETVRRSLKELREDMNRNFDALVHRPRLERISESETHGEKRPSIFERLQRTIDELPSLPNMTGEGSVVERIDTSLNAHYYTIAYCVVITAYVVGFAEYVYLRLVSILLPEKITFHKTCTERANETVGKDGFHYGISIGAFIVMAIFQLICFFGLTISEKWTRTCHFGPASAASIRRERLASHIRTVITKIMYRTFLCYGICSGIICMIIFYMVGIRDSVDETASTICLYIFDALVVLYFIAFPVTTVVYHPHVYCFKRQPPVGTHPADPPVSRGVAPLVHNTNGSRLATLSEVAEPNYNPSPSAIVPPLVLPECLDREIRVFGSGGRNLSTQSAREPPTLDRDPESRFRRGLRTTTTV